MSICWFLGLAILIGCQGKKPADVVLAEEFTKTDLSAWGNQTLSSYGFFKGDLKNLEPAENIFPYSINAQLFSDYAFKKRFIKIPSGEKIKYDAVEVFHFPEGTILIKNFYYPSDFRIPNSNIRLLETRLLILKEGAWSALPYVWNEAQDEAFLDVAGRIMPVSWTHYDGVIRRVDYSIPDVNQCKSCHLKGEKLMPIGPSARQLKRDNQLVMWEEHGWIEGLPEMKVVPKLVSYEDEQLPVEVRARAWLEINCAHCHRPDGQAKTSGLHLMASVTSSREIGIGKAPVAAGKGSGGRMFSIVPSRPDESILLYRIESTDPGIMMPEMGRKLVHKEGVELVRTWISEMKVPD